MEKYSEHIKNGLFLLVLVILFLPLLQSKFKIFPVTPLKGAVEVIPDPYISKERWFSGEYQKEQEAYVKDSFGLREPLIRLYNQWNYTLYKKPSAGGVIIGRDGYLYEENYINASLGLDFIGEDSIRNQVRKLKQIAEALKKKDIDVVVLLAPGKGSFYPEFFPEEYDTVSQGETNAELFKKHLKSEGINLLDAHTWFGEMKLTVHREHKLYSKTGVHWSKYGEYLVADSLIRYLSEFRTTGFPRLVLDSLEKTGELRSTDDDIWQGMNVFFRFPDFEMTYPHFHRIGAEKNTTKVLTIADSYFWGMYWMGIRKDFFAGGEFWYYFKERYPQQFRTPSPVSGINLSQEIEKHNVVVLICTDANLPRFGFGFIDEVYASIGL